MTKESSFCLRRLSLRTLFIRRERMRVKVKPHITCFRISVRSTFVEKNNNDRTRKEFAIKKKESQYLAVHVDREVQLKLSTSLQIILRRGIGGSTDGCQYFALFLLSVCQQPPSKTHLSSPPCSGGGGLKQVLLESSDSSDRHPGETDRQGSDSPL